MIKHQEVLVATPKWKTDRWYEEFLNTVQEAVHNYQDNRHRYAFSDSCSQYSGCSFKNLCNLRNEELAVSQYNRVVWHPEIGSQEILYEVKYEEALDPAVADAFSLGTSD